MTLEELEKNFWDNITENEPIEGAKARLHKYPRAAALQSPAGEWRDISTAPKNGDEILVARLYDDGGALMEVACWYVASWAKRSTVSLAIATQGKVSMILLVGEEAPTHWMPLPPAPTGEG